MKILVCLVFALGLSLVVFAKETFHGHRLVSVTATNKQQFKALTDMLEQSEPWLDFWSRPSVNKTTTIRVPPSSYRAFTRKMQFARMPVTIVESDVEEFLERMKVPKTGPYQQNSPYYDWTHDAVEDGHEKYRSYEEFQTIMASLATRFPDMVLEQGVLGGKTYEDRDISYIRIGTEGKPVIFIEGLIHAREWVVGGVMLYFMDRLLSTQNNADAKFLVDNYDFFIVPVTNPDGYEYSRNTNRLWRKNRSRPRSGMNCRGVDLNRNFGAYWGTAGVSTNCNSDIYCGTSDFSEQESQMILNKVLEINVGGARQNLLAYLSVHSYSQMLLTPYSYANVRPSNSEEIDNVALLMNNALREPFGTNYKWGHGPILLYPVSGASDDWAKLHHGARYSYCYELRPDENQSNPGFELPANEIIPNGFEFWKSIVAMACNMNAGEPPCNF